MAKNPLSCGTQCSRITLITLNVVFLICGVGLFVVGLVFRFGGSQLKEDIKPAFENITINSYDLYTLVNSLAIIFIVAGAVVIVFSILGFIGAACFVKGALILYAVLIGILLALELAGIILFFILGDEMEKALKEGLKETIQKANGGNDDALRGAEYMFNTFDCCHVDMEWLDKAREDASKNTCRLQATTFSTDCSEEIKDWLRSYQAALITIGIVVIVIQFILMVMACWLCRRTEKAEKV